MRMGAGSLLVLILLLSMLVSCGTDHEGASPLGSALELSGVAADCPVGDIRQDIVEIFPTKRGLRQVATVTCGRIFKDFGKGKQSHAIRQAFKFLEKTLQQNQAGQLIEADPSTEAKIVHLFTSILTGLGVDFPDVDPQTLRDGEFAIGVLTSGGPPVLTLSRHAGMDEAGGLFGPVSVIIVKIGAGQSGLSPSSASHPCPAGIDDNFDCYPLFFDYFVFPESNVNPAVGLRLGQCNVSPSGVEVELLAPEGFLPEDDAPTGLDCTDVVEEGITMTGWRSYAWAVLEPISPLFRVTSAFAGKNPIGGRISAFSPVAPADPESSGEPPTGSISGTAFDGSTGVTPVPDATIELFLDIEGILVATTTTDADGNYLFQNLEFGIYRLEFTAEGFEPSGRFASLTPEDPHAENIDFFSDPREIFSVTELEPDEVVMTSSSSSEDTQLFIATVTDFVTGAPPVLHVPVQFTVTNGDDFVEVFLADYDVVTGQAQMRVGCDTNVFGDIMVPFGNFLVEAAYQAHSFGADLADVSTLSCVSGE